MANPTLNDKESKKFRLSDIGDVYVETAIVSQGLEEPTGTIEDLEIRKFTNTDEVRVVLTM